MPANTCPSRCSSSTNVQVLAQRTDEKNGYTALQLGAGMRKPYRVSRAERENFAVAKVEPKRKIVEFRVSPDNMIEVGAEITADHFVIGQHVDVTGTNQGKGFQGAMKRWNFRGLGATTASPSCTAAMARLASARTRARCSRARRWPATWAASRSRRRTWKSYRPTRTGAAARARSGSREQGQLGAGARCRQADAARNAPKPGSFRKAPAAASAETKAAAGAKS